MSQLLLSVLGVVCPNCDEYNPPKTAKCGACGANVLGDPARSSGVRPPPPALGAVPRGGTSPGLPKPPGASAPSPAPAPRPSQTAMPAQPAPRPSAPPGMRPVARTPSSEAAPIPAADLVKKPAPSKFGLIVLAGAAKGQRFRLAGSSCQVGRARGAILFPEDPFISALHATFQIRDGNTLIVKDESSASGVFVAIPGQENIGPNSYFSAGHRLFRFTGPLSAPPAAPGAAAVYGAPVPSGHVVFGVEEILVGGRPGRAVITGGSLLTIGQSLCDLSFARDDDMATRHCELSPTSLGATLRDLSGGLGTYVRISGERVVNFGDRIRIGEHVLQVEA